MKVFLVLALSLVLVWEVHSNFPANTDTTIGTLEGAHGDLGTDIDCLTEVKDGLQTMSDRIQDVRDLKTNLGKVANGLNTLNLALKIAGYAPGIGAAVNALKVALTAIKLPLSQAYDRVKTVDAKVYPWKAKIDPPKDKLDEGIGYLEQLQTKIDQGNGYITGAKTCLASMNSGNLRTELRNAIESLTGEVNPGASTLTQSLGNVGDTCDAVKGIVRLGAAWPNISGMLNKVNSFYRTFSPILDFFATLQSALNKKLCIPNPVELTAEGAKELAREVAETSKEAAETVRELGIIERGKEAARKTVEVGREAGETAREIANKVNPIRIVRRFWGRRRRSLSLKDTMLTTENKANALLRVLDKRASEICLSVQDVLDGVNSIFSIVTDLANQAIQKVMSALPSFTLPGLPSFSDLFNFNIDFNVPELNWNFDLDLYRSWLGVSWDCLISLADICTNGGTAPNCRFSIGKRSMEDEVKRLLIDELETILDKRESGKYDDTPIPVDPADIEGDSCKSPVDDGTETIEMDPAEENNLRLQGARAAYKKLSDEEKAKIKGKMAGSSVNHNLLNTIVNEDN